MRCNDAGIELIKKWEGCKLNSYLDTRGIPTIGWGHTGPEVKLGMVWTQKMADQQLLDDLARCGENPVNQFVAIALTDNEFSALTSFCYNVGAGNFMGSHLRAQLNAGNFDAVPSEIMKWCHNHDGSVNQGLLNRRKDEVALWGAA